MEAGMVTVLVMFIGGVITVGVLLLLANVLAYLQDVDEDNRS
jgi:hypothetical protein